MLCRPHLCHPNPHPVFSNWNHRVTAPKLMLSFSFKNPYLYCTPSLWLKFLWDSHRNGIMLYMSFVPKLFCPVPWCSGSSMDHIREFMKYSFWTCFFVTVFNLLNMFSLSLFAWVLVEFLQRCPGSFSVMSVWKKHLQKSVSLIPYL